MSASRQELQERVERLERIVKALARVQASYYYADLQKRRWPNWRRL